MKPILVIGAGQAGLAAGYYLQQANLPFQILEANKQVGGAWPNYYDSLTLFSPGRYINLPGRSFPSAAGDYPTRDAMAAYLQDYASHFQLPIQTGTRVTHVTHTPEGFLVESQDGVTIAGSALIAASGAFMRPYIPQLPGQAQFHGQILHSAQYRNPDGFANQRVVVVGAGNSAVQIAVELAERAQVTLATRQPLRFIPQHIMGRDLHWWLTVTGLDAYPLDAPGGNWLRRRVMGSVLDTGTYAAAIASGRPDRRPMFTTITPTGVVWADGMAESIDVILFATGYQPNLGYLAATGALDAEGRPLHRSGISTKVPKLAYVGLEKQRTIASATVRGVGPDAQRVVRHLQHTQTQPRRCCAMSQMVRP